MFLGRVPKPDEPLWLDEDRDYALALQAEEDDQCPGCGHPWAESTDPAAENTYQPTRVRCHACTPKERQKREDANEPPGLFIGVVRQ